jgi:hypothetical protein
MVGDHVGIPGVVLFLLFLRYNVLIGRWDHERRSATSSTVLLVLLKRLDVCCSQSNRVASSMEALQL